MANQYFRREVNIGPWDWIEVSEMMDVSISADKLEVICRFYPPSEGGRMLNARDIVESLAFRKIKYGMDQMAVYNFLQKREYCKDFVLGIHGMYKGVFYASNHLIAKYIESATITSGGYVEAESAAIAGSKKRTVKSKSAQCKVITCQ